LGSRFFRAVLGRSGAAGFAAAAVGSTTGWAISAAWAGGSAAGFAISAALAGKASAGFAISVALTAPVASASPLRAAVAPPRPSVALLGIAGAVLALLALATVVGELLGKRRRLRKMGMAVGAQNLVAPLLREHAASLYHLGCEVTRYYGLPLLAIGASWPPLLTVIAFLLLVGPICDHRRRKPALSLPAFIGLYWLEMASYQLGVWLGCLRQRCWRPLFPRIRWRL